MLKFILDSEGYSSLEDSAKALYTQDGDNYRLAIEGLPEPEDTGPLKRAKDREAQARREAEEANKSLQAQLAELNAKLNDDTVNNARKKGDIDALEKSWNAKLEALRGEYDGSISKKDAFISELLVDNVANQIAAEIAVDGAAQILLPHIRNRLSVDLDAETPSTRVLDEDGKPSAMTVAELKQSFIDSKQYAPIIVGNKASGSGANGSGGNGGGTPFPEFKTATEEAAWLKANPDKTDAYEKHRYGRKY